MPLARSREDEYQPLVEEECTSRGIEDAVSLSYHSCRPLIFYLRLRSVSSLIPKKQNAHIPSETAHDSFLRLQQHTHIKPPPLSTLETARLACPFWLFWFVANWATTASLNYTSVASTTILTATSGLFTLVIGKLFRIERMTLAKLCAVVTR